MNKTDHPLYVTWLNMRNRCNNPNYKEYHLYGGRGINVCPEWDDFWVFLSEMGEKPDDSYTLDRIDNDKGYSISNCRWASKSEQSSNKRPYRLSSTKGYKKTPAGTYQAYIYVQRRFVSLGNYPCPLMARLAYEEALIQHHQ